MKPQPELTDIMLDLGCDLIADGHTKVGMSYIKIGNSGWAKPNKYSEKNQ